MSVQVTYDSELMEQLVAAVPIPSSRRFASILDEYQRPLVFSIGTDDVFYLIIADENGINQRQDLGVRLGFATAAQAFGVSQRDDGTFVLVFAMQHTSNSFGDVCVLGPLKPADLRRDDTELRTFIHTTDRQPVNVIFERILIGIWSSTSDPLIIAVHRNNKDTDIARLDFNVANGTVVWMRHVELPQNVTYGSLTDLCLVETVFGPGIFYLYKSGGKQTLVFITCEEDPDFGGFYRVHLGIPAGQEFNSLTAFSDDRGMSRLLATGGTGLYQYDSMRKDAQPTLLSSDPFYAGVDNLFSSQYGKDVTVWFKNGQQTLCYHQGDSTTKSLFDSSRPPIPLTSPGQGAQFAAIIDPRSKSQRLLVADPQGFLTLKEQASDSRIWKDTPLHVPSLDKNITIQTYTIVVKLVDNTGSPFAQKDVLLTSSAWVTITIDGKTLTATSAGIPVRTDVKGTLTIMVPTSDISSYIFTIKDYNGTLNFPTPTPIDPTTKVMAQFEGMTASKLRSAKTADGSPLVASDVTDTDVETAAATLASMHVILGTFDEPKAKAASGESLGVATTRGVLDSLWDAWYYVWSHIKSVTNWVVKKVGDVWKFATTLAGKVWDFVLDTAVRVQKAMQFVFEKIGVAVQKLIEWVGFVFKWGDILETADGITSMVNGMLDYGTNFVSQGAVVIDNFFDDLESNIRKSTGVGAAIQATSTSQTDHHDATTTTALDSAPANWSNYQLDHGGVKENLRATNPTSSNPNLDFIWTDLVQPIWETVRDRTSGIMNQLVQVYRDNPNASMGEVLKVLGVEILLTLLALVKDVAAGLVRVGAGIITQIRNILNQEMKIPVLSALFKLIAGGRPLTLINAVSLLIAVPTTILAKIVTGEKPKHIVNFDYARLAAGTLDTTTYLAYNELADWVTTVYYIFNGLVEIYKIATYQIPATPDSPTSPTMLSIVMKLVMLAFTFPADRQAPQWPIRVSIWSTKAGNILLGGALQRFGPSAKATVAFDVLAGLVCFSLAQVVHDGEFNATVAEWSKKDTVATGLTTALSVLTVISTVTGGYGQLAPDPFNKGVATVIVGAVAVGESSVRGGLTARKRVTAT